MSGFKGHIHLWRKTTPIVQAERGVSCFAEIDRKYVPDSQIRFSNSNSEIAEFLNFSATRTSRETYPGNVAVSIALSCSADIINKINLKCWTRFGPDLMFEDLAHSLRVLIAFLSFVSGALQETLQCFKAFLQIVVSVLHQAHAPLTDLHCSVIYVC